MLLFTPPPAGAAGQPLLPGVTAFCDHLDSRVLYYLPTGLSLLTDPTGAPDFFLLRYHGDDASVQGGLLRFRLGFTALDAALLEQVTAAGWAVRAVDFAAARFRLRLRSWQAGEADQTGDWHPVTAVGRELLAPALALDARETRFLELMLSDQRSAVEVELDLHYVGLTPAQPWLAAVDTATLRTALTSLLPAEAVRADQVVAALLALPTVAGATAIRWQALEPDAVRPPDEVLLTEVAWRALDRLFTRQGEPPLGEPALYQLRLPAAGDPLELAWDLRIPRHEQRACLLQWSVLDLLQTLPTPAERDRLFPAIAQVSPFAKVDLHVINRVPFDPAFLRKVVVDLRYSGAAGVPEYRTFTFDGSSEVQRCSVFYPAVVAAFQLAARLTTTQAPPNGSGWPLVRRGDFVPVAGPLVEITRERVGLDFVRVEVEAEIFAKAAGLTVALFAADPDQPPASIDSSSPLLQVELTAERRHHWLALSGVAPTAELYVQVTAHAPTEGGLPPYRVYSGRVLNRQIRVAAYQLEVLDPDPVTIQLDPTVAARFALVNVTVASLDGAERTYGLTAEQPVVWYCFRESVFAPLCYRYRLAYVALDEQGQTLPLVTTAWTTTQASSLVIRPAEGEVEPQITQI